jgi:hypothetical protein
VIHRELRKTHERIISHAAIEEILAFPQAKSSPNCIHDGDLIRHGVLGSLVSLPSNAQCRLPISQIAIDKMVRKAFLVLRGFEASKPDKG